VRSAQSQRSLRADPAAGDGRRRLLRHDHLVVVVVERRDDVLGDVALALEHARLLPGLEVHLVEEVVRRDVRPIREVLRALEVHGLAVGADQHDRLAERTALGLERARVVIEC